jgi:hypothetical protein
MTRVHWKFLAATFALVAIVLAVGCAPGLIIEQDSGLDQDVLPGQKPLNGWRRVAIIPFALIASVLRVLNRTVIDPCFKRSGWDRTVRHPHRSDWR